MTERTRLLSYSPEASGRKAASEARTRTAIPKRGVILLWSALALVINITLCSLRSRRLEVARERRGSACLRGPWKSFLLAFQECGNFLLAEKLLSGLLFALGEKTVNQRKHEIVCWTRQWKSYVTPLNGIIEVQILEVTSIWFNGTMCFYVAVV